MNYSHVTFLLCLPRSRSAWLAKFVEPGCAASWHCPLQNCASISELRARIDAFAPGQPIFVADVAALFFFQHLLVQFPGAQYLVVHRPSHEVEASMSRVNIKPPLNVRAAEKQLLGIAAMIRLRREVMSGTYFELNSEGHLGAIYKFVTGQYPTPHYVRTMMRRNVQRSVAEQILTTDFHKQRVLFGSAKIIH